MYWDVVEVKPQAGYRLFVRFKDGLTGVVQLRSEDFTGVLAPLSDERFFEQVFIDCGAVAWPGEIDLAPDAIYAQIAESSRTHLEVQRPKAPVGRGPFRDQLPRFYELKDLLVDAHHPAAYFRDFEQGLQDASCLATFAAWENELQSLDPVAWAFLKRKASQYLTHGNVKGQKWHQLFDALGEASAYRYLREREGCSSVWFIDVSNVETPDLEGVRDHDRVLCEVKTINISLIEVGARRNVGNARKVRDQLDHGFFHKLDCDIAKAMRQLQTSDPDSIAQHIVYIKICFDDWSGAYDENYLRQIKQYLSVQPPNVKVVVKPDLSNTEAEVVAEP